MRRNVARSVIIVGSLATTGVMLLFFIVAPALHYRMEPCDAVKAAETAVPPFVGYLGSAVGFVLGRRNDDDNEVVPNLGILIIGPFVIFGISFVALVVVFSTGTYPDLFQGWLTAIISVVTLTVGVASQKLFAPAGGADSEG